MTNFKPNSMSSLPQPAKGRGGLLNLALWTVLALIVTGGALFWLMQDEEEKKVLRTQVKENVETVVKDTPLEKVVQNYIPNFDHGAVTPSTVAKQREQRIQGAMSAPPSAQATSQTETTSVSSTTSTQNTSHAQSQALDEAAQENTQEHSATETKTDDATTAADTKKEEKVEDAGTPSTASIAPPITPVAPKVTQDTRVPLSFVDDAAQWFVQRYTPRTGANFSLSSVNLRYGQKMHALMPEESKDVLGARSALLRYAFNSPMMSALYDLYAVRFVQSMQRAAAQPAQENTTAAPEKILQAYAKEFATLGSVLQGIGSLSDFSTHMQHIEKTVQASLDIHSKLTEVIFEYDAALEKKDTTATNTIQMRIDGLNAQYQRSIHERTLAREAFITAVRKASPPARSMSSDDIIYISQWLERRLEQGQDASSLLQSAQTAGTLLQDLSAKLQKASAESLTKPSSPSEPSSNEAVEKPLT